LETNRSRYHKIQAMILVQRTWNILWC
jgi:hypothetical protein